jgi:predicted dehydrogenase
MRALIVGFGSIGQRHLANLRQIEPDAWITVWHQRTEPEATRRMPPGADAVVYSLDAALSESPDAAIIASPAPLHVHAALALADQGSHLFVEKPLSDSLEGIDALIDLCHARSVVLMVGYHLRFCRSLQIARDVLREERIGRLLSLRAEVGQYLPEWRPESDYRHGVSARQALGGGVLLELSHELDYVRWLAGDVRSVQAQIGHLSNLDVDVEDVAELLLRFSSGAVGSVHLDMVQRPMSRLCKVVGTAGSLTWDGITHNVRVFSAGDVGWTDVHAPAPVDRNAAFVSELQHFLGCVRTGATPLVGGEDGRLALELALAAKSSSVSGQTVHVTPQMDAT